MKYYAHINSKDILTGIDMSKIVADEYGSEYVKNIEVDKTLYDTAQEYGIEYYIYQDGEIIENPNYEEEIQKQLQESRNKEIDEKIKELSEMASTEMIKGNTQNVETYKAVINSLEESKN